MIGTHLGHYSIEKKIGEGGMGVVYKAQDLRLLRSVALKILPLHLTADEKTRFRFEREAQAASALNHPNICTVYDVGEENGVHYIAMEFVDGETLRETLHRHGTLPEAEVVAIGLQVCEALAAAHAKGIIHRDIKPDNIMLTPNGRVKVMDFGLAKLKHYAPEPISANGSQQRLAWHSPINTSFSTLQGTASYMSPEQIEKGPVDERTDIFSLGVVLYELLTGKPPFSGADGVAVMKSILQDNPPPPAKLQASVSSSVETIILQMLAKKCEERFENVGKLRTALENHTMRLGKNKGRRAALLVGGSACVFLIGMLVMSRLGVFTNWQRKTPEAKLNVYSTELKCDWPYAPAFMSGGEQFIIFDKRFGSDEYRFWKYDLGTQKRNVLGKISKKRFNIEYAEFSPDGRKLAFVDPYPNRLSNLKGLWLADTAWVNIHKIADFGKTPKWSPNGEQIVFSTNIVELVGAENAVYIFDLRDSTLQQLSPKNGLKFAEPSWSPDGRWIICVGGEGSRYAIWLIEVATGQAHALVEQGTWIKNPLWAPSEKIIYFLSDKSERSNLWQVRVDLKTGVLTGEPQLLDVPIPISRMNLSPTGDKLVLTKQAGNSAILWVEMSSARGETPEAPNRLTYDLEGIENMEISPDGNKLVLEIKLSNKRFLSIIELTGGREFLLYDEQPAFAPNWSPDGKWIAFDAGGGNQADIWRIPATGGRAEKLIAHPGADWMPTYAPDGKRLCFLSNRSGQFDLWVQDLETGEPLQITNTLQQESRGAWSHSGKKLAFWHHAFDSTYAEIRVFDFATATMSTLKRFAKIKHNDMNVLNKLLWRTDDKAIYDFHETILIERNLDDGTSRDVHEREPAEGNSNGSLYTIFQNNFYYAVYSIYWEIWIVEGLTAL